VFGEAFDVIDAMLTPVTLAVHGRPAMLVAEIVGDEEFPVGDLANVGFMDVEFLAVPAENIFS
jgi:hypothetical protein